MVLLLDTEVDTSPDPLPWVAAARLSGMIINIDKVINLFIRYKT